MRKKKTGPKTEYLEDPLRPKTVYVDARTVRLLDVIGSGNVSKGIRRSARHTYDEYQRGRYKIEP